MGAVAFELAKIQTRVGPSTARSLPNGDCNELRGETPIGAGRPRRKHDAFNAANFRRWPLARKYPAATPWAFLNRPEVLRRTANNASADLIPDEIHDLFFVESRFQRLTTAR
jgi:hypothetical protein